MNEGLKGLEGHAYAPGAEPGAWAQFVERMTQSEVLPLAGAMIVCCLLAGRFALSSPALYPTRNRKKRDEDVVEGEYLTTEELQERLRQDGVIQ